SPHHCSSTALTPSVPFYSTITPSLLFYNRITPSLLFYNHITPSLCFYSTITPSLCEYSYVTPSLCEYSYVTPSLCEYSYVTPSLCLYSPDLGLEGTSLNDILYKNAAFLNLVDPISHELLLSLARDMQCPKKTNSLQIGNPVSPADVAVSVRVHVWSEVQVDQQLLLQEAKPYHNPLRTISGTINRTENSQTIPKPTADRIRNHEPYEEQPNHIKTHCGPYREPSTVPSTAKPYQNPLQTVSGTMNHTRYSQTISKPTADHIGNHQPYRVQPNHIKTHCGPYREPSTVRRTAELYQNPLWTISGTINRTDTSQAVPKPTVDHIGNHQPYREQPNHTTTHCGPYQEPSTVPRTAKPYQNPLQTVSGTMNHTRNSQTISKPTADHIGNHQPYRVQPNRTKTHCRPYQEP
ncbi:hypothetical protein NFI96_009513, partial [Prochilodus magdalenae]